MMAGTGAAEGLLFEYFGLFRLYFRLTVREEGLAWSLVRWRFLGLPLPRWTTPSIECLESADGARFVFDIDFAFPIMGMSRIIAAGSSGGRRKGLNVNGRPPVKAGSPLTGLHGVLIV